MGLRFSCVAYCRRERFTSSLLHLRSPVAVCSHCLVSAQVKLFCLKTASVERKITSCFLDAQVALSGVPRPRKAAGRTMEGVELSTSFSISLLISHLNNYENTTCRLQRNVPAVVLLFFIDFSLVF